MDKLRRKKGASVSDRRRILGLDYDLANRLLNVFVRKVYESAYNKVIGPGEKVAGLTVEQKDRIHANMFNMILIFFKCSLIFNEKIDHFMSRLNFLYIL